MAADPQPPSVDLGRRLDAVEERIGTLRELLIRAYEDTPRATATVLGARRDPSYSDAYSGEPLVTVRIGTYHGGDLLFERALASVRSQRYANWEAIVVCDGRDEETVARIRRIGDDRITAVARPRNGPYPADPAARWSVAGSHPFNQAVALARGAWFAPIDQDDEWAPDHLEALVAAARCTGAEVVYGVARVDLGDGGGETWFGNWPPEQGDFGFQTAIYHAGLASFLYDANSWLVGEPADWNLARRMLEAGVNFEFVERVVATYYVGSADAARTWWEDRRRERGPFVAIGESC